MIHTPFLFPFLPLFSLLSNRENRAKLGSVCVANHTTPIDIVMLAVDNCFTLVKGLHDYLPCMLST